MMIKGLQLRDFKLLKYNCHKSNKDENDKYFYDRYYRVSCIINELECEICGMKYLGNIWNYLQIRTLVYLNNIVKLLNKRIRLDLFTFYSTKYFENIEGNIKAVDTRELTKACIIIRCNSLAMSKRFGTSKY